MDTALVELIKKASPWVVNTVMLSIGGVILIWVWSAIKVLKNNTAVHATADNLIDLQNKYNNLTVNNYLLQQKHNQTRTVLLGLKSAYTESRYLFSVFSNGEDIRGQSEELLRLIIERLSTDLKFSAGESHRCAIWTPINDKQLGAVVASSGFSDYHRRYRALEIDGSTAGRCFRTKITIYSPRVREDRDFRHDSGHDHKHNSLICVPLCYGDVCFGLITVDGIEEDSFLTEDVEVVETYAEIVAMVIMMQIASLSSNAKEESAYADSFEIPE